MLYHPACLNLQRLARNVDEILAVFTFICKNCQNRTTYDLVKAIGHLNSKLNALADKAEKRDRHMREQLNSLSTTVETSSRNLDTSAAFSCNNGTESRLDKIAGSLDGLTNLITSSFSALDTRLSAIESKSNCSVPEPTLVTAVTTTSLSSEPYPTPNEPTSDGGIWMTIGSSRYWARDLPSLRVLRARIMTKIKRQARRKEKRREARAKRQLERQSSHRNVYHHQSPASHQGSTEPHAQRATPTPPQQFRAPSPGNLPQHHPARLRQASQHRAHERGSTNQPDVAANDVVTVSSEQLRMHTPGVGTWIYISGVANDVTVATVKNYISGKLNRQNIECHLLLPRDTDPSARRSLSFKAKIPSTCAYIALDSSFWPTGVKARYFVANEDF